MNNCPLCLSNSLAETIDVKAMYDENGEKFSYAICAECKSAYALNFLLNIAKYYDDYYSFNDEDIAGYKRMILDISAMLIDRFGAFDLLKNLPISLMNLVPPNLQAFLCLKPNKSQRILEVGAGNGQFVKALRRLGYNAIGIDPFCKEEMSYLKRSDIYKIEDSFDLLLFNHTFEHVEDPENILRKCCQIMTKSSKLIIHIPNIHSLEFEKYKQYWWGFHAPYHFCLPSENGLKTISKRCKLKISDKIYTSRYDHYVYSSDYEKGYHDKHPDSIRNKGISPKIKNNLKKKAFYLNSHMQGDWVAYILTKE